MNQTNYLASAAGVFIGQKYVESPFEAPRTKDVEV